MKLRTAKKVIKKEALGKAVYRAFTFERALRRVPYSFYAKHFKIFLATVRMEKCREVS